MAYFSKNRNLLNARRQNQSRGNTSLTASLHLSDGNPKSFHSSKKVSKISDNNYEVDNNDTFITLSEFATDTITDNKLPAPKAFCIYNTGPVPLEIQFAIRTWANASENDGAVTYVSMIINPGDFYYSPTGRMLNYDNNTSAANASSLDNVLPSDASTSTVSLTGTGFAGPFYQDTGVNVNASEPDTETDIVFQSTGKFRAGDILMLDSGGGTVVDDCIRILSVDSATNCTVERGVLGATAQALTSSTDVYFYFHNEGYDVGQEDDSSAHIRTDASGNFACGNFFGYGRSADATPQGIVPGSVAIKFYPPAYRMLGLSGITTASPTGLTGGTTYEFRITTSLGTTSDIEVTVDSTNTNWGGINGLLQKMNAAFSSSTATDMYRASIIQGDIKIEDRRGIKDNYVTIAAPSGGTTILGAGNFPAAADHSEKVVAQLPPDTMIDRETGATIPNNQAFMYDNGKGELSGVGTGTINYDTGAISFNGPYRSEFVINAEYGSAHGGKMNTATNYINIVESVAARTTNKKVNGKTRVIIYS